MARSRPLINIQDVMVFFGVKSRVTIYRWVNEGRIPQPVKKWGSPRWSMREIEAALEETSSKNF